MRTVIGRRLTFGFALENEVRMLAVTTLPDHREG